MKFVNLRLSVVCFLLSCIGKGTVFTKKQLPVLQCYQYIGDAMRSKRVISGRGIYNSYNHHKSLNVVYH